MTAHNGTGQRWHQLTQLIVDVIIFTIINIIIIIIIIIRMRRPLQLLLWRCQFILDAANITNVIIFRLGLLGRLLNRLAEVPLG